MLGYFVVIDDSTDRQPDHGLTSQRVTAPAHLRGNARQVAFGGRQQSFALAGALARQVGVAADHQPFAGKLGRGDLGQMAFVEQRELQGAAIGQGLNLWRAQAGDPVEAAGLEVLAQPRLRDHAAVADQHHVLQAKAALQFLDLSRQRGGIAGVALEHLDGDRPAVAVAQQAVDDLQPVRTVITAVTVLSQWAAAAFQVARADIVQHQHAVLEVAPRQAALDALLLAAQPVQGSVDLAFLDGPEVEHAAQAGTRRLGRQRAQHRQLGAGRDQPAGDHCQRQIALARGDAAEQARQVELAHHADHRGDVAVRQGALDFEHLLGPGNHAAAGEQHAQSIDHRRRQCAEIGDGALTDPLALAITLAQQHGGSGTTVRHDIDEHDPSGSHLSASMQAPCMDTKYQTKSQQSPVASTQVHKPQ